MTILYVLGAFALLILSHEFGHFIAAKKSKMRVDEFGIGLPPKVYGIKRGKTLYSLNLLPIGGFVKIFGENSSESKGGSFSSRPIYQRAIVISAGVFFNLLLAWFLFSMVFWAGAPSAVSEEESGAITILEVQHGTPAYGTELQLGDKLVSLSFGEDILEVNSISGVQEFIDRHRGEEIKIDYMRGDELLTTYAIPSVNPESGKGALGIAMEKVGIVSYPLHEAVWEGLKFTGIVIPLVIKGVAGILRDIFTGVPGAADQVAGPVGIYFISGQFLDEGFFHFVLLIAQFSIVLAVINFLPFPALDGGRLVFLIIEAIKGSPINDRVVNIANSVGFLLLLLLVLMVTYNDISRFILS
jgi:regulator of sigma E protease